MDEYIKFWSYFTDFIFVNDKPEKVDIIFVPGNGYPQMAENAAKLYREGYAPYVLPSGKYSILTNKFSGVICKQDIYDGDYMTESDFLEDVLIKNGVKKDAIIKEKEAAYTYQNAINSRKITDEMNLEIKRAIICCKEQHARRSLMYYQLMYPKTTFLVCPSDVGINRDNWMMTEQGTEEVLGEIKRCGTQFSDIMRQLRED